MLSFCANCWEYLDEQVSARIRVQLRGFPSGKEPTCQCRGQGFNSWFRKIPHAVELLSPWAITTSLGSEAQETQLLKPHALEAVLCTRRVTAVTHSHITTREESTQQQKHSTAKTKIQINKVTFKTQENIKYFEKKQKQKTQFRKGGLIVAWKFRSLLHSRVVVIPQYPEGIGSTIPIETKIKIQGCSSPLYKMVQYLHMNYTHPLVYFKSFNEV